LDRKAPQVYRDLQVIPALPVTQVLKVL
jgi:hypothetical protein